ncbi:MAG: sugar phosphate isomerase/epimerase [Gemmataceae bacterium]|nr:sugar phosphate isomerase/epimerase [Gemmataceae bacterium]
MKLGFYTYSYIDRLGMGIEEVLERVAAAGYDSLDLSATWRADLDPALMPAEARKAYVRTASRLNLPIEAVVTHLGLAQSLRDGLPINLAGAVDVARDLGAPLVTFHIGEGSPDLWPRIVDHLRGACDHAGKHGKLLLLDGVWGPSLASSPADAVRLAREVGSPHFRHNYDPCYLELSGFPAAEASLFPHASHVHAKDYDGRYPAFRHRIPGEGVMDHAAWIRALHEAGYAGHVANECFIDAPLERALAVGHRALSEAMGACGARP